MTECNVLRSHQQHSRNGILVAPQTARLREQNLLFIFISAFMHLCIYAFMHLCIFASENNGNNVYCATKTDQITRMHKMTL